MPTKPLRPCARPGCRALTKGKYCEVHAPQAQGGGRLTAHQRGYTHKYRKARDAFLADHPWCVQCRVAHGVLEPATELDHIIPHKGNQTLFWDKDNWQGLCKHHHSAKTASEDGGFGNARKKATPPPGSIK